MASSTYSRPLILRDGQVHIELDRIDFNAKGSNRYDESYIQKLAFENPSCIPVADIDRAYEELVPVCMEFNTPAGPVDALYVTPTGRLVILEAKLWRNPEARRKVVAQILDYAKEFSRWDYEDLQRELSRHFKRKGNVLYELVAEKFPDTDEARFVDEVHRSLKRGRFLLIILGDGIREGAGAIANFLERVGNLEFTFGLVELAMYGHPEIGTLVQPRVIARSVEFKRTIIELPEGARMTDPEEKAAQQDPEREELLSFYREFWGELIQQLQFDDPSQPLPNRPNSTNLFLSMPPSPDFAWVSAYFSKYKEEVGVYLALTNREVSESAIKALQADRENIDKELAGASGIEWTFANGKFRVTAKKAFSDVHSQECRAEIKAFFSDYLNRFVNVFRPRLERLSEED